MKNKKEKNNVLSGIIASCITMMALLIIGVAGFSFLVKKNVLPFGNGGLDRDTASYNGDDTGTVDQSGQSTEEIKPIVPIYRESDYNGNDPVQMESESSPPYTGLRPFGYYESIGKSREESDSDALKNYDPKDVPWYIRDPEATPEIVRSIIDLETVIHPELYIQTPGFDWVSRDAAESSGAETGNTLPLADTGINYGPITATHPGPITIGCVGDSITAGAGLPDPPNQCYPALLQAALGAGYRVENYGRPGSGITSYSMFPYKLEPQYTKSLSDSLDAYIIMLGTNDAIPAYYNSEHYIRELTSLVNDYLSLPSAPRVILMTPPKYFGPSGPEATPLQINDSLVSGEIYRALQGISRSNSLMLIDMYSFTKDHPEWFPDGIHPNEIGTRLMTQLILGAIK